MRKTFTILSFFISIVLLNPQTLLSQISKEKFFKEYAREFQKEKIRFNFEDYLSNKNSSLKKGNNDSRITSNDIENPVSTLENTESEISIAINPLDSNNIIISPIKGDDQDPEGVALSCPIYYTKDFGKTWRTSSFKTKPLRDFALVAGGGDPVLVFDSKGVAYLTWINIFLTAKEDEEPDSAFVGMYWAYSEDGGETWKQEGDGILGHCFGGSEYTPNPNEMFSRFYDKQWMAADHSGGPYDNSVYVCLMDVDIETYTVHQYLFRKENGAKDFIQVPTDIAPAMFYPQYSYLDVDGSGTIHCTFSDFIGFDAGFFHVSSTNGGESFGWENEIALYAGTNQMTGVVSTAGMERLFPGSCLAADKSDSEYADNLYFSWTSTGEGRDDGNGLDIKFSKSEDHGLTWSDPITINDDPKGVDIQNYYSMMAVSPDGVIAIAWYDRRDDANDLNTDIYMTYSFDGGETFIPNFKVTSQAADFSMIDVKNRGFSIGEYNQMVATKGYAIPVWADGRNNNGDINVYTAFVPISRNPVSVESLSPVNSGFTLHEPIPNPAKQETKISFSLREGSNIRIDIVDIQGNIVISMDKKRYPEGESFINIDLSELADGAYFCYLFSNNGYAVKKLNVVK